MTDHLDAHYDECLRNLENLSEYYSENVGNRNEATTRLHLIDTLLFECLGWAKHEAIAEEHHRTDRDEYTDYTFYAPRRVMILEAKREGETFEIPAGRVAPIHTIKSLCRSNPKLKAAIEQTAGYCQSRGVPLGVISNGHQLLAFVSTRSDGVPPMDGKAIVFSSFLLMLEHFLDLWNCLSKPGVEEKHLEKKLLGSQQPELPPTLADSISSYPGMKGRNPFQAELKHISELAIEDIPQSPRLERDFLTNCYCPGGALSQHSLASKAILRARYAALFDSSSPGRPSLVPASNRTGISDELFAESMSRRPILLLGDVGVGKSTFIRNLVHIDAADLFSKAIALVIDLGSQAALTTDLKHFIIREIQCQLLQRYQIDIEERNFVRGVYDLELKKLRTSIYADLADSLPDKYREKELELLESRIQDKSEHCRCSLEHVTKARQSQVVIFIDNADQRGDSVQDEAFLIAQEMATRWPVLVYVPLRPETFHRSVSGGALSGYHPKAFTVAPPRVDRVLDKRLRYALNIADDLENTPQISTAPRQTESLKLVIRSFLKTLRETDELLECIDNIAAGNIRLALDLVKNFFGSGHVDTEKICEKSNRSLYIIPLHEFVRALIYGDHIHYHPARSPVANLFDVSAKDPKEHFLLPILLAMLRQAGHENKGFVETALVYSALQGLAFTPEQVDFAIVRAFRKRLIQTPAAQTPEKMDKYPRMVRVTTSGLYHVDRLCSEFAYLDAMIVAAPILDDDIREQIRDVSTVKDRVQRGKLFQHYLDNHWTGASFPPLAFNWLTVSEELGNNIKFIERRIGHHASSAPPAQRPNRT